MADEKSRSESIQRLREMINGIKVCMLTTINEDGTLQSRPMATLDANAADGVLWFFTAKQSLKAENIRHDRHVNLGYAEPDDNRYVSISGRAQIVEDAGKIRDLWNPMYKAWFPDGVDDPNLALLRVTIEKAEFWDATESKMVMLAGFLKAITRHEEFTPGEHGNVQM